MGVATMTPRERQELQAGFARACQIEALPDLIAALEAEERAHALYQRPHPDWGAITAAWAEATRLRTIALAKVRGAAFDERDADEERRARDYQDWADMRRAAQRGVL